MDIKKLIDEGVSIDKEIKDLQTRMKEIKKEINKKADKSKKDILIIKGNGKNKVRIVKKRKRIIEPKTIQVQLTKKKKKRKHFFDCITVNLKNCLEFFTEEELDVIADDWKTINTITFKGGR